MFDMGFTEMMLIGIVALIVIGPERLPGVARTAGKYFARLKRFVSSVKADVEQELRADELREILAKQQQELDSLRHTITDAGKELEEAGRELEKEAGAVGAAGASLADSAAAEPAQQHEAEPAAESAGPRQEPAAQETEDRVTQAKP